MSQPDLSYAALKESLLGLFSENNAVRIQTYFMYRQPDQTLRSVMARAHSIANANDCILRVALKAIGLTRADAIQSWFEKSPLGPKEHFKLEAAQQLLGVALKAWAAVSEHFGTYNRLLPIAADIGRIFEVEWPEGEAAIDDKFNSDLAQWKERAAAIAEILPRLQHRLPELRDSGLATILAEAAEKLVTGLNEDVQIAAVEKQWKDEPDPQSTGSRRQLKFLTQKDAFAAESVGTRVGFLRSAANEAFLAHQVLDLLLAETKRQLPEKPASC